MEISNFTAGDRIDKTLVKEFPTYSRSQLQKLIQAGSVTVNGKQVSKHYFLEEGDVIVVTTDALPVIEHFTLEANPEVKLDIIAETDQYVVIHKPAGLVMHPADAYKINDTMASGLLAVYPDLQNVGDVHGADNTRPGIVHRLDKNVSGIVVIAKTQEMFDSLKQQFAERHVTKEYIALVHGVMSQTNGVIDFDISRSTRAFTKMAAVPQGGGKNALTHYDVVEQFQHYALLKLRIETGRTHQIRVHCNAIGHPIVGDTIYKPKSLNTRFPINRIFLHAAELQFVDLDGEPQHFISPLPKDLQDILDDLYT